MSRLRIDRAILQIYFKKQTFFYKRSVIFVSLKSGYVTTYSNGIYVSGTTHEWNTAVFISVYSTASGAVFAHQEMMLLVLFLISALLAIMAIVLFKNRKLQFVLNRLNIIFNLTLLGVFVYRLLTLTGEAQVSEKGIGSFFLHFYSCFMLWLIKP